MNVCHWYVQIKHGDVVQSVECLLVEQRVAGSNPVVSAISCSGTTKTQWKNTHRLLYYTKEERVDRHRHLRQLSFHTKAEKISLTHRLCIGFILFFFFGDPCSNDALDGRF